MRCHYIPSDLHAQGISRRKGAAVLHAQSGLCNNTALLSAVLNCSWPSCDQCVCVQAANRARTSTDDYLHDLLRKSENRALEAEGQTRHYSQRVRTLEWQKFQDKQSDCGLAQKHAALVNRIRQEKRQVEERLHGAFTRVSSLEEAAARAKQLHAADLSQVVSNLQLSQKVRLIKMNVCHV